MRHISQLFVKIGNWHVLCIKGWFLHGTCMSVMAVGFEVSIQSTGNMGKQEAYMTFRLCGRWQHWL